jgi:hypothetical protein
MKVRVKKKDFLKACTDINLTVRKGEPTELHQWKLGSLLAKEFVEVEAEPIEAVKCEHEFKWLKLYNDPQLYECKICHIQHRRTKCNRLHNYEWEGATGKLNQEFDNIYAILEGVRK